MKCPHCGITVEPGTIFCPKCLTEIPWVPEYNTVETMITKEQVTKEKLQKIKEKHTKGNRKRSLFLTMKISLVVLLLAFLALGFGLYYRNSHSFDYQYQKAQEFFAAQDMEQAFAYIERAEELDADRMDGQILYARILQEKGKRMEAEERLKGLLAENPEEAAFYEALIQLYLREGEPEKVKELLENCKQEAIQERFTEYIAVDPVASVDTGVYDAVQKVTLSAEDGATVYYTLDGSAPTMDSSVYGEPILVTEGVTEINAFSVNAKGIPSDVVYWKYTVVIKGPDAPVVSPEEGTYEKTTLITMEIPDGCKGYYCFDGQVSTASEEYTEPVEMPEGTHTFQAILVAANGKESETVDREYTYAPAGAGE